ncbi:hypothetical protein HYS00_05610, partial [Candidatus Microgenomates bacterium]|nr:hypothetical protein [Candidatus Microgenomates bacterium]
MNKSTAFIGIGVATIAIMTLLVVLLRPLPSQRVHIQSLITSTSPSESSPPPNHHKAKLLSADQVKGFHKLADQLSAYPRRMNSYEMAYSTITNKIYVNKKDKNADSAIRLYLSLYNLDKVYGDASYGKFETVNEHVDLALYKAENIGTGAKKVLGTTAAAPADEEDSRFMNVLPNIIKTFTQIDLPTANGTGVGGTGGTGGAGMDLGGAVVPPESEVYAIIATCLNNKQVYLDAEQATGVPWYILAAIHYREGSCGPRNSVVSGRGLGDNEPDVVAGIGCSTDDVGPGKPIVRPEGGCMFDTLLNTAIYGGNLLKGKVDGNLNTIENIIKALSRYNGGGNHNCGAGREGVPYTGCPALCEGEDEPYPMNKFDT